MSPVLPAVSGKFLIPWLRRWEMRSTPPKQHGQKGRLRAPSAGAERGTGCKPHSTEGRSCCSTPAGVFGASVHCLSSSGAPDTTHCSFVYKSKHQTEQINATQGVVPSPDTGISSLPSQHLFFNVLHMVMVLCSAHPLQPSP